MTDITHISSLDDVQAWLGTLSAGTPADVGTLLFANAPMVAALFALLPDSDPIAIANITAIDIPTATLTGQATVLGEEDTTVTFAFSQAEGQTLLCKLTLALPESVRWTLLSGQDVVFEHLVARLVPNAELSVVRLTIDATLRAGATITIPVLLHVPMFDGDWTLHARAFAPLANVSSDDLARLLAGNDLTGILPATGFSFDDFTVTGIEMSFNFSAHTVSLLRVRMRYGGEWKFFDDAFEVRGIDLDATAYDAFGERRSFTATVRGQMEIPAGGATFDVGAQFPDNAVFAQLAHTGALRLHGVFDFFRMEPPRNFPEVDVTRLAFVFFPGTDVVDFQIGIDKPFAVIDGIDLESFLFEISATYDSGVMRGSGALATVFRLGRIPLHLSGRYASGAGLSLSGELAGVPIGEIVDGARAQFGVSVPAPISSLSLRTLTTTLTTGDAECFDFACAGTAEIAGVNVEFNPRIAVTSDPKASRFAGSFSGTMRLTTASQQQFAFEPTFSKDPADSWMTATCTGAGNAPTFEHLAEVFGLALPDFPPDLELDPLSSSVGYDFSSKTLAFAARSKSHADVVLVSTVIDDRRSELFVADAGASANLPHAAMLSALV